MQLMVSLLALSAIITLGAFLIVSTKRETQRTGHLSHALLCVCLYIAGSLFEATSNSHFSAYRSIVVEYLGLPFIAPHAFLALADFYEFKVNSHVRRSLFAFPLLCSVLVVTGNQNSLFYASSSFVAGPPLPHLEVEPTPLYILSVSYTLVLLLLTQGMVLLRIRQQKGRRHLREVLLFIAIGLPIFSNLLYLFSLTPYGLDLTPLVLSVTSGLIVYAVQRLNLLQVLPLAKSIIVDKMTDAFIIVDHQYHFLEANRAAREIYPSLSDMQVGDLVRELIPMAGADTEVCGAEQDCPPMQAADGRFYRVSQTNIAHKGKHVCSCFMLFDITETQSLIHALDQKATHDALTQVYNRGAFFQMAGAEFAAMAQQEGQGAILMFDLDHFKRVNDTYGHRCGDRVLQLATQRLKRRLRDTDLFGRYGGEEFCAFLLHISAENAVILADKLRRSIEEEPFLCEGHSIPVTMSVGVATYDKAVHDSVEAMVDSADAALYTAKETGRNKVVLFGRET